jgi:diaminopimelate epimerase
MKIPFSKYHGAGNDFIMIDNTKLIFKNLLASSELIAKLCHRRFGIGADGLILINNSRDSDFEMIYYNSDGNTGSMCGNGGRCSVAFAHALNRISEKTIFSTSDGMHHAEIISQNEVTTFVKLQMQDVKNFKKVNDCFIIDTGSPHCVLFTKDVEKMDVFSEGKKIRYSKEFKEKGINVDFAEFMGDHIFVRTYERGVEDETLSCGTGVTATAIAANELDLVNANSCSLKTPGGELKVYFSKTAALSYSDIWLEGPTVCVYKGEIEI